MVSDMVHGVQLLKCKEGHAMIGFDENQCGCHHQGLPCVMIHCEECLNEGKATILRIPIHPDYIDEVKEMLE